MTVASAQLARVWSPRWYRACDARRGACDDGRWCLPSGWRRRPWASAGEDEPAAGGAVGGDRPGGGVAERHAGAAMGATATRRLRCVGRLGRGGWRAGRRWSPWRPVDPGSDERKGEQRQQLDELARFTDPRLRLTRGGLRRVAAASGRAPAHNLCPVHGPRRRHHRRRQRAFLLRRHLGSVASAAACVAGLFGPEASDRPPGTPRRPRLRDCSSDQIAARPPLWLGPAGGCLSDHDPASGGFLPDEDHRVGSAHRQMGDASARPPLD